MKTAKIIPFKRPKLATDPTTDAMLKLSWTPFIFGVAVTAMCFNLWKQK